MMVLKATPEVLAQIDGFTNGVNKLEFVPDGLGNMIVGKEILNCPCFDEIRDTLLSLEEIDFVPNT